MPGAETFRTSPDAYNRLVGRYSPQLAAALIDFAGVEPGRARWTSAAGRARSRPRSRSGSARRR